MHCWKTINVKKQYGFQRIFLLSTLLSLGVFLVFYILLETVRPIPLSDTNFIYFLLFVFLLYPIHKALHLIPLANYRANVEFIIQKQRYFLPILILRIKEPIPKRTFIIALVSPFILLNLILIIGAIYFPSFTHYFTMLLAYHCGLCLIDLLHLKHLSKSPKNALIEETENGYEILVPSTFV